MGHLKQIDLEVLGSLISLIEWQCLDENHNRDSAHILYNIFKFCIHIYSVNVMQLVVAGFLSQHRFEVLK